jgi:hypothetical protein
MKKILYVTTAAIALLVIMLFIFYNSGNAGTQPTQSLDADTIISEIESERPVYDRLLLELDSTEIYNDSIIYGYWFQPHAALEVNLFLHKNGRFEFKKCDVTKKGTFMIDGYMVALIADDGWGDEPFDGRVFHKHNGTNFYLTDSNENYLYLVKGSD